MAVVLRSCEVRAFLELVKLKQGTVDGAENNPPSFYLSGHYEICRYYSLDQHTWVPDVLLTFSSADGTGNLVYRVPRGETLQPGKSLAFTVRMPKKPGYAQAPSLKFDTNGV